MSASIDLERIKEIIAIFEKHNETLSEYSVTMYGEFIYSGNNTELIKELNNKGLGEWDEDLFSREFKVNL